MVLVNIFETFCAHIFIKCPVCGENFRMAYISNPLLCCEKCGIVYEVHFKKSELSIADVKGDGWLKESIRG